jgi:hypothetical protein
LVTNRDPDTFRGIKLGFISGEIHARGANTFEILEKNAAARAGVKVVDGMTRERAVGLALKEGHKLATQHWHAPRQACSLYRS